VVFPFRVNPPCRWRATLSLVVILGAIALVVLIVLMQRYVVTLFVQDPRFDQGQWDRTRVLCNMIMFFEGMGLFAYSLHSMTCQFFIESNSARNDLGSDYRKIKIETTDNKTIVFLENSPFHLGELQWILEATRHSAHAGILLS
jgi:hypothetical protein